MCIDIPFRPLVRLTYIYLPSMENNQPIGSIYDMPNVQYFICGYVIRIVLFICVNIPLFFMYASYNI